MSLKLYYTRPPRSRDEEPLPFSRLARPTGEHPVRAWDEALPLGNGRLGVTVWGMPDCDLLQLNEETLWDGRFDPEADNPECAEHLKEIQKAIFSGDYAEGQRLTQKYVVCRGAGSGHGNGAGKNYGSFQNAGEIRVEFLDRRGEAADYRRTLNLSTGLFEASWDDGGRGMQIRVFTSFDNGAMLAEYRGSEPFCARVSFLRDDGGVCGGEGRTVWTADSFTHTRSFPDSLAFAVFGSVQTEGKGAKTGTFPDGIVLSGVTALRIVADVRTTYVKPGIDGAPLPSNDPEPALIKARKTVGLMKGSFEDLFAPSAAILSKFMRRVKLSLSGEGADPSPGFVPTDERLRKVKEGELDTGLLLTYFNFGRYLLVSSSFNCVLPANLQGIWSPDYATIWSADYHVNINLQMNYWLAETCRMPELTAPLIDYVRFLSVHGRRTAAVQYGKKRGWVAHTITNPWGFTAPGECASWGSFTCAGAWCCQHVIERWLFSGDKDVLRNNYDVLRGACEFFLEFLTEDPRTGCLVTCPSNSPENSFCVGDGVYSVCAGPAMDSEILRMLFSSTAQAARILSKDEDFARTLDETAAKLPPVRIGKYGQIMEWSEDFKENEPGHRHISQLFALHPDNSIDRERTPELFEAAKVTLKRRLDAGGGHTGWSRAWIANFFARLGDGDACLENLRLLLARSTLPNMFDTHPPFQIDGNFGGANAFAGMLLNSRFDPETGKTTVFLLPALPGSPEWRTGRFEGFAARGGFAVDCAWEDGKVTEWRVRATDHSSLNKTVRIVAGDRQENAVVTELAADV